MGAYIVRVEKEHWPILQRYLNTLQEGGILVAPHIAEQIEADTGESFPDGELLEDYNYGGEADLYIDVVHRMDHWSIPLILKHIEEDEDHGEE